MPTKKADIAAAVEQLRDRASAKRRSAAKTLRKAGRVEAGPALIAALDNEIRDPRTWETQYQMAMALGECRVTDALPLLHDIAARDLEATMVLVGIGDAVTRLEQQAGTPFRSLRGWLALEESRLAAEAGADAASSPGVLGSALARGRSAWKSLAGPGERPPLPDIPGGGRAEALVQGSLQAVALTRLVPESDFIDRLIGYASSPVNEYSRFFVALACSGWDGDNVVEFLHACLDGAMEDTRRAAVAALEKTYMRWQPL